jgi:hypothetical protein
VVKVFGFIKKVEEPCVYKKVSGSAVMFLVLYLDNILLIRDDISIMEAIKSSLRKSFSMKDLGEATYILGIKIQASCCFFPPHLHNVTKKQL